MRKGYSRSHANRGAGLERMIDITNTQYRNKGVADIRKVPTPVQIHSNVRGRVTGYTQKPEWVDYSGVHDGRAMFSMPRRHSVGPVSLSTIFQNINTSYLNHGTRKAHTLSCLSRSLNCMKYTF
ncbi:Holliday junction resolvase RecU [Sporosarcina sp. Te-1]|nr:Holliday junction resolvase RecU [Sporosarcina sp. Te-1]